MPMHHHTMELRRRIIRAMANNAMSIADVARELGCHRNTVEYHIKRIRKDTGLNPRKFFDLCQLLETVGMEGCI